jgi:hypothetical protein
MLTTLYVGNYAVRLNSVTVKIFFALQTSKNDPVFTIRNNVEYNPITSHTQGGGSACYCIMANLWDII